MTPKGGIGQEGDEVFAVINTTPLVDVMLVLLIIFLITIPVVTHSVLLSLPKQRATEREPKRERIEISVDRQGKIYWRDAPVDGTDALLAQLKAVAQMNPQPELQIRGDLNSKYAAVGSIVDACRRVGIVKLSFITDPPARNP